MPGRDVRRAPRGRRTASRRRREIVGRIRSGARQAVRLHANIVSRAKIMADDSDLQRLAAAHAECFVKLHRKAAARTPGSLLFDLSEADPSCDESLDRARGIMTAGGRRAWQFVLATIAGLPDDEDLLEHFGAGDFEYCWSVEGNVDPFLAEIESELGTNPKLRKVLLGCWPRSAALSELRGRLISSGVLPERDR
jgi:hypothetical protein